MRRLSPPRFIRRDSPKRNRYSSPIHHHSPSHRNGRSSMELWNGTTISSSSLSRQRSRSRDIRRRDLREKIRLEEKHSSRSRGGGGGSINGVVVERERESIHKRLDRSSERYRDEIKEKNNHYHRSRRATSTSEHRHASDEYATNFIDRDFEELREEPILDPSSINFYTNMPVQEEIKHSKYIKPYIEGDNGKSDSDRINRLEKLVEKLVEGNIKNSSSSGEYLDDPNNVKAPKGVTELIPSNTEYTVSMWLNKIHEESVKRFLNEKSTIHLLEDTMTGIIKSWYKTVLNFKYTWPELRMIITKNFPDNTDFASTLKLLVSRDKLPDETFTQYYFSKLYLCEACGITGKSAVSCLIDGLNNQFLKQDIKLYKFPTPEALYNEYLIKYTDNPISEYQMKTNDSNSMWPVVSGAFHSNEVILVDEDGYDGKMPPSPQHQQQQQQQIASVEPTVHISVRHPGVSSTSRARCTTCRKRGHTTMECRHAPVCYNCSKRGHIAMNCPNVLYLTAAEAAAAASRSRQRRRRRRRLPINQLPSRVNGLNVKGIIDTGSIKTIVSDRPIDGMGLTMLPCRMEFHGIGGSTIRAIGMVRLTLKIDKAREIEHNTFVVRDDDIPVDLIIGQDFLRHNVTAVFTNGKVIVKNSDDNETSTN